MANFRTRIPETRHIVNKSGYEWMALPCTSCHRQLKLIKSRESFGFSAVHVHWKLHTAIESPDKNVKNDDDKMMIIAKSVRKAYYYKWCSVFQSLFSRTERQHCIIGLNRKLKANENESRNDTSFPLLSIVPRSWSFGDFEEHNSG